MIVQFVNRQSKHPTAEWRSLLGQVLPAALTATAFGQRLAGKGTAAAVTVTFAGPRQMRKINRETRQVDSLTDVLSYPLLNLAAGRLVQPLGVEDYDRDSLGRPVIPIGDIILSLDKAFAQAQDYGHSSEREVAFLAVLGLLHLLGYDHLTSGDEKRMLKKQKEILDQLGLGRGNVHD